MQRLILPALIAAVAATITACASAAPYGSANGGQGGRYRIMIPEPQIMAGMAERDAQRMATELRSLVSGMPRHTSVDARVISDARRQSGVEPLDAAATRQLAQQIGAQNVLQMTLSRSVEGASADIEFMDVASGEIVRIEDVTAPSTSELVDAVFSELEQVIEGILQAAACNDYLSSRQYERAISTCDAALAVAPTSTAALYGKATALLYLERTAESLELYQELLALDGANSHALLGAGLAASTEGQTDEALAFYNRYLELNPGDVQVRITIAGRVAETGDYVSALRVLEPAIEVVENRENPEFQRFLFGVAAAAGQRVAEEQDDAAARPIYETALQAYALAFPSDGGPPPVPQIRQAVAVNLALGRIDDAVRIAREATTQYESEASVWSQYATALGQADRHAEAIEALTRVIALDADYEDVYLRRGMASLRAGQRPQAMADLREAAQRGRRDDVARLLFNDGNRTMTAGRFAEAASTFATAAEYATGDLRAEIGFYQGYALVKQGEAIASRNTEANLGPAREALDLFRRALPLVSAGSNAEKAAILSALELYIANHEAIVRARSQ